MARLVIGVLALASAAVSPMARAETSALPDPTRPPMAADGSPGVSLPERPDGFAVTTILFAPTRRIALLNGRMVHEGSTLGAARVVRIERDAVFIEIAGQSRRLPVYADPVHKPGKVNAVLPPAAVKERKHD
jgi:hypothetical protein